MTFSRSSGVLVHPTSFPSKYGIGDLGDEAYRFIDFLVHSGQQLWQVLPLGPTGFGDSPYACFSAFAGNPFLVSPDHLVRDGLIDEADLAPLPDFPAKRVDFGKVVTYKLNLLATAYAHFTKHGTGSIQAEFAEFCREKVSWLEDYALFRALKDAHNGASWDKWPTELKLRETAALAEARATFHDSVEAHKYAQFLFFRQWKALRTYCGEKGIRIIGDIPIFVAFDSADVWCAKECFKLDTTGTPTVVAGVPPDYFSKDGQLWGNPLYNWEAMHETGYAWWIARVKSVLDFVDIIRMDHFRGFAACWEVKFGAKTAKKGRWVKVPGRDLFQTLRLAFPDMPIIAEDLGVITPDVVALRDEFEFPGMRILQFGFSSDATNHDLPHNYLPNCVVYVGTHDNDTAVGWFHSSAGGSSTRTKEQVEREQQFCLEYLNTKGKEIHWDFIRTAWASVADISMVQLQDVLGLDSTARMNLPGSGKGNWEWRYQADDLTWKMVERLKKLTELYGRTVPLPKEEAEAEDTQETEMDDSETETEPLTEPAVVASEAITNQPIETEIQPENTE